MKSRDKRSQFLSVLFSPFFCLVHMLRSFQCCYRTCQRVHSGSYEVIYFHIIFVRNRTGRRRQYSHGSRYSGAFCIHGNKLPLSVRGTELLGQAINYESSKQEIYFMEPVKMTSIYALRELASDILWVQVPCSVILA